MLSLGAWPQAAYVDLKWRDALKLLILTGAQNTQTEISLSNNDFEQKK